MSEEEKQANLREWGKLAFRYMNEAAGVIDTIETESSSEQVKITSMVFALEELARQYAVITKESKK